MIDMFATKKKVPNITVVIISPTQPKHYHFREILQNHLRNQTEHRVWSPENGSHLMTPVFFPIWNNQLVDVQYILTAHVYPQPTQKWI